MSVIRAAVAPTLASHGEPWWSIDHHASQYNWRVKVADDTAEGTTTTEPDALREIALALEWLQGGVAKRPQPKIGHV